MTFLIMLSVKLLSVLMIQPSTLSVISHLICGNNYRWLLNLNMVYEALWTGTASDLLISVLEKTQLILFNCYNNTIPIEMKNGWVCQALKSDLPVHKSI